MTPLQSVLLLAAKAQLDRGPEKTQTPSTGTSDEESTPHKHRRAQARMYGLCQC